jgi:hypothetical protein
MDGFHNSLRRFVFIAPLLLITPFAGCVGFTAQLLYLWKGNKVPAAFSDLEDKRVAIVCVSDSSAYGPGAIPTLIAEQVESILEQELEDIELVGQDEVADWIDHNNWDQIDYRDIGRGVKSDMVVAVDLEGLSVHEGQTLYRGRVNVRVSVFDMTRSGKKVYSEGPRQFVFPQHAAVHSGDMSESQFRRVFIRILSQHIARHFHPHDFQDGFGKDAILMGS